VIGKALLVTTQGGHSAITIQFAKSVSQRLARLHKVTLMLRLVVRAASVGGRASTTLLKVVTLGR